MVLKGPTDTRTEAQKERDDPRLFSRWWCLTFYDEDCVHRLRSTPHQAFVCAREEATDSKMEHYQCYIRFANKQRASWFKTNFQGYVEHPTELGEDGGPKRFWNHWEARRGTEQQARQYIVDVAGYLEKSGDPHPKTQGEILHDYGCAVDVPDTPDEELAVIKMVSDRAPRWQIFKEYPRFYFKRRRDVLGLEEDVTAWHSEGVDYHPDYKKAAPAANKKPRY